MKLPIAVVIPALDPVPRLLPMLRVMAGHGYAGIIVVNDGSGAASESVFHEAASIPGVAILRHAVNLGKGAALKTGFNHALLTWPEIAGVVTADADGQHHPEDILTVAQRLKRECNALILGVRRFHKSVPLRSRAGNAITRILFRVLLGRRLSDTQTGLRGIPRACIPHLLKLPSMRYEFELDMLMACKYRSWPIAEQPIRTIYEPGNRSSHFDPLADSMRIYFVLLRFSAVSMLTALIDNAVFYAAFRMTRHLAVSQICGRAAAVSFNYTAARRAVFLTRTPHREVLPRYLLLVCASGLASYSAIRFLNGAYGVAVMPAKILVETALFLVNFTIQRDYIFTRRDLDAQP